MLRIISLFDLEFELFLDDLMNKLNIRFLFKKKQKKNYALYLRTNSYI